MCLPVMMMMTPKRNTRGMTSAHSAPNSEFAPVNRQNPKGDTMNLLELVGLFTVLYCMLRFLLGMINCIEDVKREEKKRGLR